MFFALVSGTALRGMGGEVQASLNPGRALCLWGWGPSEGRACIKFLRRHQDKGINPFTATWRTAG